MADKKDDKKKNPADAIGGLFDFGKRLIARRKELELDDPEDMDPAGAFKDPDKRKKKDKKNGLEL